MEAKAKPGDLRWPVALSSAAVVMSFILATLLGEFRTALGDNPAVEIASTISPTIEQLASLAAHAHDVETAVGALVVGCPDAECGPGARLLGESREVGSGVRSYVASSSVHLTVGQRRALTNAHDRAQAATASVLEALASGSRSLAQRLASGPFRAAIDGEEHELSNAVQAEARFARLRAGEISETRRKRVILVIVLDSVSVATAVLLTWLALGAAVAQQRLQRARAEELEMFAGRVAHDIITPVAAAALAASASLRDPDNLAGCQKALGRVVRCLRRAREISDALLEFARAGARPRPGDTALVRGAIEEAVADVEDDARAERIEIVATSVFSGAVACSSGALASILGNLLRNAIKYMGDGSVRRICVRAFWSDHRIRFEVEDSGPGLPEELTATAFEPFIRGEGAVGHGVGLGLATVKRLVDTHRGVVGVSKGAGGGCKVWFELPEGNPLRLPRTPTPSAAVSPTSH
jgi:signal transduction histidine kinase